MDLFEATIEQHGDPKPPSVLCGVSSMEVKGLQQQLSRRPLTLRDITRILQNGVKHRTAAVTQGDHTL
jgi:hypothetical protein